MRKLIFFILTFTVVVIAKPTHYNPVPQVEAERVYNTITVDGDLSEPVWQKSKAVEKFYQSQPAEGKPASEQTKVLIVYDDNALYIAARLFDSAPDSISATLGRRDHDIPSDLFGIFISPYHDNRSGFYFGLNAAGTRYDGTLYNDDWMDESWDGVWDGTTRVDSLGWCAEFRIPFSQLRFQPSDQYVWGINFRRDINRKNEEAYLAYTPKNSSGFVSRFPDLVGIKNIQPSRHFEVMPYVRSKMASGQVNADNPLKPHHKLQPDAGFDVKYGLGPNLTLDMTVNPDFGQVEVDPAVVNLSDYETFYDEKRPFFIEGSSIFSFGYGGANNHWGFNWGTPDFFYSRRIGRAPGGHRPSHDYSNVPAATTILGAGKVTGKVGKDWNVGGLYALTASESGRFQQNGEAFSQTVEPQTHFGVVRAQKEIDDSRYGIGFLSTYTRRDFRSPVLRNDLNKDATTLGIDGWSFLDKDKTWVVSSWLGGSHVTGTQQRITDLQSSSLHYFQRPGVDHVNVDSSATSLSGLAGRVLLNKQKGNVLLNSAVGFISPGFDVNDVGFAWRTDLLNAHFGGGYRWTEPGKLFRQVWLIGAAYQSTDFSGHVIGRGLFGLGMFELKNFHNIEVRVFRTDDVLDNRLTRGGPLAINPAGTHLEMNYRTDQRKEIVLGFGGRLYQANVDEYHYSFSGKLNWKPEGSISFSVEPELGWYRRHAQWIGSFDDPAATATFGKRYVFGRLDHTELSANLRLDWAFTPKLSLQLYMQPLISHGHYDQFKELAKPKSFQFNTYSQENISYSENEYTIEPKGSPSFSFSNPDFHFKSLRGNAVLRWEYQPGSTLYFVWTQERLNHDYYNGFYFDDSVNKLFHAPVNNVFMIKMTYWMNI